MILIVVRREFGAEESYVSTYVALENSPTMLSVDYAVDVVALELKGPTPPGSVFRCLTPLPTLESPFVRVSPNNARIIHQMCRILLRAFHSSWLTFKILGSFSDTFSELSLFTAVVVSPFARNRIRV